MARATLKEPGPQHPTEASSLLRHEGDHRQQSSNGEEGKPDTTDPSEPSTLRLSLIMGSIWLGCFMSAIDTTVVATLAVPITSEFQSLELLSWLATSYMIAQTALTPMFGRLTDIFGRRAGLLFSNLAFGTGTLICGLAADEKTIIMGRVLGGMGAGGLNAISAFIATDLIPLRKRGLWQGFSNLLWGVGAGLGGVYGGWMHDQWGWRWAFIIQVPLIFVSMALVMVTVKEPRKERRRIKSNLKRIDFLGSFLLVAALVLLLLGLSMGGNILPWSHHLVITCITIAVALLGAFIYVEERFAVEPIIPIRLLNRTVAAACFTNWFDTMVEYVLHYYGPIFFETLGYTATESGTPLVFQSIGVACGSLFAGYMMRVTGRYWWLSVSFETLKVISAVLLFALTSRTAPVWPVYALYFACGFAYAGMLTTALVALVSAVDQESQALVTSASYTFRFMGSAVGVALASSVFQNVLRSTLWEKFAGRQHAERIVAGLMESADNIRRLPLAWQEDAYDSYMSAVSGVWLTVTVLSAMALVVSLFVREHKLHTTLGRE